MNTISRHSKIITRQFSASTPSFATIPVNIDVVEDETAFVNLGQQNVYHYMQLHMNPNELTSWATYPEHYKFYSVHFELNADILHTDRSTYDALDFLSDIGGVL